MTESIKDNLALVGERVLLALSHARVRNITENPFDCDAPKGQPNSLFSWAGCCWWLNVKSKHKETDYVVVDWQWSFQSEAAHSEPAWTAQFPFIFSTHEEGWNGFCHSHIIHCRVMSPIKVFERHASFRQACSLVCALVACHPLFTFLIWSIIYVNLTSSCNYALSSSSKM